MRYERMLQDLLRAQQPATFDELPRLVTRASQHAGFDQARVYLSDIQQYWLVPMSTVQGEEQQQALRVDASLAGRAYRNSREIERSDESHHHVWLPLSHNAERIGVLHLAAALDRGDLEAGRGLARLVALLLLTKRSHSDTFNRLTRTRNMDLSAEVQWHLLPPSTFAAGPVVLSGALEPAYSVGGDAFDYALTGSRVGLAIFDAMGHELSSAVAATIAVQSWRNIRHAAGHLGEVDLAEATHAINAALVEQFGLERYVTGLLAELDTATGYLRWVMRGHPAPLLIRDHQWIKTLHCPSAPPMGLDLEQDVQVCSERLQPGDRLVFYTDGVINARNPQGEEFGEQRFADFVTRHDASELSVSETLRQLVHAIMAHQQNRLQDDATLMLAEWPGAR